MLLPILLALGLVPFVQGQGQGYIHNITSPGSSASMAGIGASSSVFPLSNGTDPTPFSTFTGSTDAGCGTDPSGTAVDIPSQLAQAEAAGLPMLGSDGSVSLWWKDDSAGAAGALSASYDPTGTGRNFTPVVLLTSRPDVSGSNSTHSQLTVQLPSNTTCTAGPEGDACLLRVMGGNGTYGSCFAVRSYSSSLSSSAGGSSSSASGSDADPDANDDDDVPTPTAPNSRPSPSRLSSVGALPSGMKRSPRALKHAQVRRKNTRAAKGGKLKRGMGSAWSRAKRWRTQEE